MSRDIDLTKTTHEAKSEYQRVKAGMGMLGIPWPWAKLNEATLGIQPEELIFLYARPKSLKDADDVHGTQHEGTEMLLIRSTHRDTGVVSSERLLATDGRLLPVRQWTHGPAPSFESATYCFRWAALTARRTGPMPSVAVTTKSGLRIGVSEGHPLLTPSGYVPAGSLKIGGDVATAKRLPTWQPSSTMSPDRGYFLALLLGDGGLTKGVSFTKTDQELIDAVRRGAELFGASFHPRKNDPITFDIVGVRGKRGSNPVLNWLRELGVAGKKSVEKFVPEAVLTASRDTVRAFLAGMLDTDGTAQARTHRVISWSTGSERLARELQHLLMRCGVRGIVSWHATNFETVGWSVAVYSAEQHRLVCDLLTPFMHLSRKRNLLLDLAEQERLEKRNVDTIPRTDALHSLILSEKARLGAEWPRYNQTRSGYYDASKLFRRSGRMGRHVLRVLASSWGSEALQKEADTWIQWDRVMSVDAIGIQPCQTLTVEHDDGNPNFVCEGFVLGQSVRERTSVASLLRSRRE